MSGRWTRSWVLAGALAVGLAGCGDGEETVTVDGEVLELVELEVETGVVFDEYTSSAFGGVRFSVNPEHLLHTVGDLVSLSVDDEGHATVGLITLDASGMPVTSAASVLESTSTIDTVQITPTGTAIDLFGFSLVGYDITSDPAVTEGVWIYAADRVGGAPQALYGLAPHARLYIGDTPSGPLAAWAVSLGDAERLPDLEIVLGSLVDGMELTGAGLDPSIEPADDLTVSTPVEPPAPAPLDPDGATPLDAVFSPIDEGRYQIANTGRAFSLDISGDWFVQPNFPGLVVLTVPGSFGPGDRDVVFWTGVVDVLPVGPGPSIAGEAAPIATVDDVFDALADSVDVTDVETVDLGGVEATRFDLAIARDAACTDAEPCEFAFRSESGFVKPLRSTHAHRIWWIQDGASGPTMIIAMSGPGSNFIAEATELVGSIEFG